MTIAQPHIPDAERIDAYIAGGLLADERTALEVHLTECAACAAALADAKSSDDGLRKLFADARPAAGFEDRLIRAVRQERRRRLWILLPVRRAAIAAAAVLVIGAAGYYGTNQINTVTTQNRATVADVMAPTTQPENSRTLDWVDQNGASAHRYLAFSFQNSPDGDRAVINGWQFNKSLSQENAVALDVGRDTSALSSTGNTSNHNQDGQSVLYGNGHVDFQKNPFVGSQRDNSFTSKSPKVPDAADSILLPTDDAGVEDKKQTATGIPANSPIVAFKPTDLAWGESETQKDRSYLGKLEVGQSIAGKSEVSASHEMLGTELTVNGGNTYAGDTTVSAGDPLVTQVPGLSTMPAPAPPVQNAQTTPPANDGRKVIRNGVMEFEVESFDSAFSQITKIVGESSGFVSTTDSQKLPNGKVKGTVTLRVPPERLDMLVLSLRALGDLKSQQIAAQDVSKEYNDLESELAASKAMEARLLDLIKSGNGAIKDLLAAEKELGVWREKIAQAEGQIRYFNNLISMSTLSITLYERDIKTLAAVVETQTADVGVEAVDVEKARNDALKSIEDAKGRVLEAELKRFDGGQLAARIVADVPSDSAGPVIDRLKQIGRVARLEVHRQQTASEGGEETTAAGPLKVERKPMRLLVSLYNVANVAPRKTTNVSLAAADVEAAYASLLAEAKALDGRVVTSNLERGDASQNSASVVFEVPPEKLDAATAFIATAGDVLKLSSAENADTANTTDSKHGFTVQLVSLASVQPRENVHQAIAASDVPSAYHAILDAANSAHCRIRTAQLNEQDRQHVTAVIELETPRSELDAVNKTLAAAGETVARDVVQSSDAANTVDSKVLMQLTVVQANRLAARETTTMEIQVSDPTKAVGDAQTAAVAAGGTVVDSNVATDRTGRQMGRIALDVPLAKAGEVLGELKSAGTIRSIESSRDAKAPDGALAHAHLEITFGTSDAIVGSDTGLSATVRDGLATSVAGLLRSVQWVVVGLCLIGPWVVVAWVCRWIWRRGRRRPVAS